MRPKGRRRGYVRIGNSENCLMSKDRRYVFERSRAGVWKASTSEGEPLAWSRRLKSVRACTLRHDIEQQRRRKHLLTHSEKHNETRKQNRLKRQTVGIIGHRGHATRYQIRVIKKLLDTPHYHTILHSDSIGVEALVHEVADHLMKRIITYPPLSSRLRADCKTPFKKVAVSNRLENLVSDSGLLIALPRTNTERPKDRTWRAINNARKLQKPLIIVFPNKITQKENFYLSGTKRDGTKSFRKPTIMKNCNC